MPKATIEGIPELIRTLNGFPERMKSQVASQLHAGVKDGEAVARQLTPRRTGFLESSWYVTEPEISRTRVEVDLGNDADYAAPVIFGHRTSDGGFVEPQDMLTPAIMTTKQSLAHRWRALGIRK